MQSTTRTSYLATRPALWCAVLAMFASLFVVSPASHAAINEPSSLDATNLVLPDGITATIVSDYSKAPNPAAEGKTPYTCLGIYLVSSLSTPTVVHVTNLSLTEVQDGTNLLYGGPLSGYLTIQPNTLDSAFLPSSQALGRLSPGGYFSNPKQPKLTTAGSVPDVLNCQSASLGRMYGLTISSRVNYVFNHDLFLSGTVDLAAKTTYDISSVVAPTGFTPSLKYVDTESYVTSCITRDGRSTTIGIALKRDKGKGTYLASSGTYIATDVTVNGVAYETPGVPNLRSACVPVAIIPNDDLGDITGDREIAVAATIVKWGGVVKNSVKVQGSSKLYKFTLGTEGADGVAVTYDPKANQSFVWFTSKSRGSLVKCKSTAYDYSSMAAKYTSGADSTRGTLLVTKSAALKKPLATVSSGGADTYAVIGIPANVFLSAGTLTITGSVTASDSCTR